MIPTVASCCHPTHVNPVLKKEIPPKFNAVCVTVAAIFSAVVSPYLFAPAFIAGFCWGAYTCRHVESQQLERIFSCGQIILEKMSGIKFPNLINYVCLVIILLDHIHHHSMVYTPISGLFLGAMSGKIITQALVK